MNTIQFIRKYNLGNNAELQVLKYGYSRYAISCNDYSDHEYISNQARKYKVYAGSFINNKIVFIMNPNDFTSWKKAEDEEQQRVNAFWINYHNADARTRALLACGAIE